MRRGGNAGTPDGSKAREMHQNMPAGSCQREQSEQGQEAARQQVQTQLMHASWSLDDEPSGASCSPYAMSPLVGRNSPLRASPRAAHASQPYSEQQQQHWQQRQGSPQRAACHSPANAAAAADDGARNSSPKQRRLAEAMAAEAKAAAAAVLRGPPASAGSSASSMLAHRAGEQQQQQQQQQSRHRTPERMTHSPARSPRHADTHIPIMAGVVGTSLSVRSTTPTERSIASSNGFEQATPQAAAYMRSPSGRSGRATAQEQTLSPVLQGSADWQQASSSGALYAQHSSSSSSSTRLQQQQQEHACSSGSRASAWPASEAAAGECQPQAACDEPHFDHAAVNSRELFDLHSRVSSAGPPGELSFAASPAGTDGGSGSSAGGASQCVLGRGGPAAATQASTTDSSFRMQPAAAAAAADYGSSSGKQTFAGQASSISQSKKGHLFKCCFLQTSSATASPAGSGAGAPDPQPPSQHADFSRMGCQGASQGAAGGFGGSALQDACAEAVHAGAVGDCRRDSCMADDGHSFCSAESVAATSWTGSCAGTERDMSMSCSGSMAGGQHFPLQPLPPPPLWASPLFPPPEGYLPVGVEEEQHSHHAHFTQRVKMLRMQAAAADAGCQHSFEESCADSIMHAEDSQHSGALQGAASVPLRQKHTHQRFAEQQQQEDGLQVSSTALQEPVAVPGLRVKVKGSGWSAESPGSDRIKAFFEEPSHNPFAVGKPFMELPVQAPPVVLMPCGVAAIRRLSDSVSEAGFSTHSSSAGYRPASACGKAQHSAARGISSYALSTPTESEASSGGAAEGMSLSAWKSGNSSAGQRKHRSPGDPSRFEHSGRRLAASPMSAAEQHDQAACAAGDSGSAVRTASPHRQLQVTAVPGSALYSRRVPVSPGSSPRFAPARLPPSPRRGASISPPPAAATAAAALATAKAEAANEAAEKAQTAADAAAAEARVAAARAAAARVYKASAAAAAAAAAGDSAASPADEAAVRRAAALADACAAAEAQAAAVSGEAGAIRPSSPRSPSAKAAMQQAKKAAAAAAEATAAAVAAEAKAVEAATAAVVAVVAEEAASRASSPHRLRQQEAPAADASSSQQPAAAGASASSNSSAARAEGDGSIPASPRPDRGTSPASEVAAAGDKGDASTHSKAAAASTDSKADKVPAVQDSKSVRAAAPTSSSKGGGSSSPAMSPRKVSMPTSPGCKTPKSYAAMSAAKLGLRSPMGLVSPVSSPGGGAGASKAATSRATASMPGAHARVAAAGGGSSSSSNGTMPASAKFPRPGSALSGAAAAGCSSSSSSGGLSGSRQQDLLLSCPGSIGLDMLKAASMAATAAAKSEQNGSSEAPPAVGVLPEVTAEMPIEERLLIKQQQLMQVLSHIKGARSRTPSPAGRGGSRNASPARPNSRGPSAHGAVRATPSSTYVGLPTAGRIDTSPASTRSRSISPRQARAASPVALAQLAVPAYRKQAAGSCSRPDSPDHQTAAELAGALLKAMRSRSPERMARPGQAVAGATTAAATPGGKGGSGSPAKQREEASPKRTVKSPLPRVATLLHAADAATSASAAVRAATPPKQRSAVSPTRVVPASSNAAARKSAGVPAAAAAAAAAAQAAKTMAAALIAAGAPAAGPIKPSTATTSSSIRSLSPARAAGATTRPASAAATAAAGAAAGRLPSPSRVRAAGLMNNSSIRPGSSFKSAAADEKTSKVVRQTLIALDDLMPAHGSSSSSAAAAAAGADKRAPITELRSAAETLLKNLQAGQPIPQDALKTILLGAQALSRRGASPSPGQPTGAASEAATGTVAAAAEPAADGKPKSSSAKLQALAQQLAALVQDMGASVSSSASGTNSAAGPQQGDFAATAAAKAAATAAAAAAAAMAAADRQSANKERKRLQQASQGAIGAAPKATAAQPKFPRAAAAAAAEGAAANKQPVLSASRVVAVPPTPPAAGAAHVPLVTPGAPVMVTPFGMATTQDHSSSTTVSSPPAPAAAATAAVAVPAPQALSPFSKAAAALLPDPAKAAAAAAAALERANAAAAAALARGGVRLAARVNGVHGGGRTPRRRQPMAQKLLRMVASGRKGLVSKCHRMPSVAGSVSGGGCATPRVLTASAAASLPKSSLGLTPVAARKPNVLRPKSPVSKHSSFRLLTPWLTFKAIAAKQSTRFYTQAFRASVGGLDGSSAAAAAHSQGPKSNPGLVLSATAAEAAKQLQQRAASAGRALNAGVTQGSEAVRKFIHRTSSSGMSILSLKSHKPAPCFVATGEVIAEAADEETAGTAAPAISAADHSDAHQMLSSAEAAASAAAAAAGTEAEGRLGDRVGSSNGRLTAGKVPKCPPMMSRAAYLQYLKQQSQLRRMKAQQDSTVSAGASADAPPAASAAAAAAAATAAAAAAAASSRRQSMAASCRVSRDPSAQTRVVLADPATAKVANCISSILMLATANDGQAATAQAATGAEKPVPAAATPAIAAPAGISTWGSGLGFATDPHWSAVAAAAEAADAVLASSKAAASLAPAGTAAAAASTGKPAAASAAASKPPMDRVSEQSTAGGSEYSTSSGNTGAAAAAAAAAAVAAVSAAAAAAEAKAAAAAANSLMGHLRYAEHVDAVFADRHQQAPQLQEQQHKVARSSSSKAAGRSVSPSSRSSPSSYSQLHRSRSSQGSIKAYGGHPQPYSNSQQRQHAQQQEGSASSSPAGGAPGQLGQHWQQRQQQQQGLQPEASTDSALLPKDKRPMQVCARTKQASMTDSLTSSLYFELVGPVSEQELLRQQLEEQEQQAQWEAEQLRLKQQLLEQELHQHHHQQESSTGAWSVAGADAAYLTRLERQQGQGHQPHQEEELLLPLDQQHLQLQQCWDNEQQQQQQLLMMYHRQQQQMWDEHMKRRLPAFLQEQETAWANECRRQQRRRHKSGRRRFSTASDTSTTAVSDYTDICSHDGSSGQADNQPNRGGQEQHHHQQQRSGRGKHGSVVGVPSPLSGKRRV